MKLKMRLLSIVSCMSIAVFIFAQQSVSYRTKIIGKWNTVEDKKSSLVFYKNNVGSQLYNGQGMSKFRYLFIDSASKHYLLMITEDSLLLNHDSHDTDRFEIFNLSDNYLSIFDEKTSQPLWVLEKDKHSTMGKEAK